MNSLWLELMKMAVSCAAKDQPVILLLGVHDVDLEALEELTALQLI